MPHICSIYAAYFSAYLANFSAYLAKFRIFFIAYLAPKRPAYFKKNFRYKPVSLVNRTTGKFAIDNENLYIQTVQKLTSNIPVIIFLFISTKHRFLVSGMWACNHELLTTVCKLHKTLAGPVTDGFFDIFLSLRYTKTCQSILPRPHMLVTNGSKTSKALAQR